MKATRTILGAAQRTPRIHFLGPRHFEAEGSHTPHAHPSAPPEYQGEGFQAFVQKLSASWGFNAAASPSSPSAKASSGKTTQVFAHFWEVPQFKTLRMPDLEEADIEVVLSGGASATRR